MSRSWQIAALGLILLGGGAPLAAKPRPDASAQLKAGLAEIDEVTGLAFVRLPKACFRMGSPAPVHPKEDFHWRQLGITAPIDQDERPVHKVCVSAFSIGQTEVTAEAWQRVTGAPPPFGQGKEPASGVSWMAVQKFIASLNQAGRGAKYRLPTEAEWEYACRAGKPREEEREDVVLIDGAWYAEVRRYQDRPQKAGQLASNAWGLFDMLGNVWEWTEDVYRRDAYRQHALYDPRIGDGQDGKNADRVIRGASFRSEYLQVRCAARGSYAPAESLPQIGFRLVIVK